MTPDMPETSRLRVTLRAERVAELAQLVCDLTGAGDLAEPPYLAPALLLSELSVKQRLAFPQTPGKVLLQEYQSIAYQAPVRTDEAMTAMASTSLSADSAEYGFELLQSGGRTCARLTTVVRLMAPAEVTQAKPARFGKALAGTNWSRPITLNQGAIDAYLALSGDENPIHRPPPDDAPFDRALVPGLLLGSLIQPCCEAGSTGNRLDSLKMRFMAPLFAGEVFRIGTQPRGETPDGAARLRAYLAAADERALSVADLLLNR